MFGCKIHASGTSAASIVNDGTATIVTVGCEYDRTTISGTITDIARIVTNTAGNAYADVKLIKP